MAIEERLPPACAFAISVLTERNQDPDAVPEEAVEAAEQHIVTCARCVASQVSQEMTDRTVPLNKKKKLRRVSESSNDAEPAAQILVKERPATNQASSSLENSSLKQALPISPSAETTRTVLAVQGIAATPQPGETVLDCQQCRQLLPEYAEALADGQPVAVLYPEVHEHLLQCDTGCLVLMDLFKEDAKVNKKYRRRAVRDPFSAIGWELSGFFRSGQIPMSTKALAYGTLMLLLLVASLGTLLGFTWNENRHSSHVITRPTPDGVGLSDGLKIFDACNAGAYQNKRDAALAISGAAPSKADGMLSSAIRTTQGDGSGCNAGEAAIYQENLHVRQSHRPFGVIAVNFDSTAGDANPTGGSDRHVLYAAGTQELVGTSIVQKQYNAAQMKLPGAPLLYLVLANTTGTETGAVQVADMIGSLAHDGNYAQFGLLVDKTHPLLGVLGSGTDSLIQSTLPTMCRAGIPLIAPTVSSPSLSDQVEQTSLYSHCAPGFGFVRLATDDKQQTGLASYFAYTKLNAKNAAVIYNPNNSSSNTVAQTFIDNFNRNDEAHIVALETTITSDPADSNSENAQWAHTSIVAALNDALQVKPRPDVVFASLQTSDTYALAQAIARLPQNKQPVLILGGESIQPTALQALAQWAHQNQLVQPRIYIPVAAAVRPKVTEEWQKQFYASFCTSFAPSGSSCSSASALDQQALLFADGLQSITRAIGPAKDTSSLPKREQLVQKIQNVQFMGVSSPISLHSTSTLLITNQKAAPVLLNIRDDGTIQIVEKS